MAFVMPRPCAALPEQDSLERRKAAVAMQWIRTFLPVALVGWLVGGLVAGCSFPDAAVWRAAAYNEISAAQLDVGNVAAARVSAGEALWAAEEAHGTEYENWAAAVAAAAFVRFGPDGPELAMFLANLELGDWRKGTLTMALLFATLAAADRGDLMTAAVYAARLDDLDVSDEDGAILQTWAKSSIDPFPAALTEWTTEGISEGKLADGLALLAFLLARNGNPDQAMEILVRDRDSLAIASDDEIVLLVPLVEGLISGVREGYRDIVWGSLARNTKVNGSRMILLVALETALSYARRDGMGAADRALAEIESADDRVKAYALLAHRLAAEGRLAKANTAATAALETLRFSPDIVELDEDMVARTMPGLFRLAGEAIPVGATAGDDTPHNPDEPFGSAMQLALVQAYLGDRLGATLILDEIEIRWMAAAEDSKGSQKIDSEDLAHLCWAYVLIGDLQGAQDLAWRIDDPDIRAFALLPVVAALADRGDFATAQALAGTMLR